MRRQPDQLNRPRLELCTQHLEQRAGRAWRDLVLDGDMRTPRGLILWHELTAHRLGYVRTDRDQAGALDAKRHALSQ